MAGDEILKTGTTTIGLKLKDGVILATDQRATMGNLIANSDVRKVYPLSDNIGMTIAGSVGDAQLMVRYMTAEIALYSMKKGTQISVRSAATLVSNVIRQGFYLGLIVGGYDPSGGHVYSIDGAGGYLEDKYMSVGSGSVFALGSLEGSFKDGMTKDEGMDVAITALNSSRRRDTFSGDGFMMAYIDKDGYQEIPQSEIVERCEKLGFRYPN
jgi:proteasome beta subunit